MKSIEDLKVGDKVSIRLHDGGNWGTEENDPSQLGLTRGSEHTGVVAQPEPYDLTDGRGKKVLIDGAQKGEGRHHWYAVLGDETSQYRADLLKTKPQVGDTVQTILEDVGYSYVHLGNVATVTEAHGNWTVFADFVRDDGSTERLYLLPEEFEVVDLPTEEPPAEWEDQDLEPEVEPEVTPERKFHVGDRVKFSKEIGYSDPDLTGTVTGIRNINEMYDYNVLRDDLWYDLGYHEQELVSTKPTPEPLAEWERELLGLNADGTKKVTEYQGLKIGDAVFIKHIGRYGTEAVVQSFDTGSDVSVGVAVETGETLHYQRHELIYLPPVTPTTPASQEIIHGIIREAIVKSGNDMGASNASIKAAVESSASRIDTYFETLYNEGFEKGRKQGKSDGSRAGFNEGRKVGLARAEHSLSSLSGVVADHLAEIQEQID